MATYVLVPGAGHGGWCYQLVAELLRAQGHQVYALTLTGLAERLHLMGPHVDLDCHVCDVVELLRFEDLREVILVGHGYAGMVITGAADRMPHRVGHLVYLDAPFPANGQSLADIAPGPIAALRRDTESIAGVEMCHPASLDALPFYGVSDPAILQWMMPRLTPHPWRCFEQPLALTNSDALRTIPQSHISSPLGSACRDVGHLRELAQGRFWEVRSGHDMMLTEPHWIADKLAATAEWLPRRHAP